MVAAAVPEAFANEPQNRRISNRRTAEVKDWGQAGRAAEIACARVYCGSSRLTANSRGGGQV